MSTEPKEAAPMPALVERLRELYTQHVEACLVSDGPWACRAAEKCLTAAATIASQADRIASLEAEVAALRKDGERLDWVCAHPECRINGSDERGWSVMDCSDGLVLLSGGLPTPRAAIDSAIAAKGK